MAPANRKDSPVPSTAGSTVFVAQVGTAKVERQGKCRETKPTCIYGAEQSTLEQLSGTKVVLIQFSYNMRKTLQKQQ